MAKKGDGYGTDWVMMPDGEGQPQVAILKQTSDGKLLGLWEGNRSNGDEEKPYNISEDINYRLYTRYGTFPLV